MKRVINLIERNIPTSKLDIFGHDSWMNSPLPYYFLIFEEVVAVLCGIKYCFFFLFLTYGVLPLLDEVSTLDERNPSKEENENLRKNDGSFKLPLYTTIILDWVNFKIMMSVLSDTEINMNTAFHFFGYLILGLNILASQFALSHQLYHKQGINKYLGILHMMKNLYMHFAYEHLYGHHRKVATPEDPASAQKNQSIYSFVPQAYFGSYRSVFQMEKELGKPFYLNYSVLSVLCNILFLWVMFRIYGLQGGVCFLIMALGSIVFMESTNYIEHYGLRRKRELDGTYEKVTIRHSWNSPHRFSNYFLFKQQRHSDHHSNSLKEYQTLASMDESPFLPHGYTVSIFMCFFPATWFRIMNPLVDAYSSLKENEVIDENLHMRAQKETQIFIMKMFLATTLLFVTQQLILG